MSGIVGGAGSRSGVVGTTELDYEEGTWSPIIGGSGGQSGQSYGVQTGTYTKVGRLVCAAFYVTLTAKGTITGSEAVLGGFPFTSNSSFNGGGSIGFWSGVGTNMHWCGLYQPNSTAWAYLTYHTSAATAGSTASDVFADATVTDTTRFNGTITYNAA